MTLLPCIRPELTATVLLSTVTFHDIGIIFVGCFARPHGVVVEGKFRAGGDILQRKKSEMIQMFIIVTGRRDGHNLAIGVARMVHEACWRAELLAINDIWDTVSQAVVK